MAVRGCVAAFLLLVACAFLPGNLAKHKTSSPGGAGYALLFHDNVIIKNDFNDFPETALTFEAWLSSSDLCHTGAILSYAKHSTSNDIHERTVAFNHFVIFDPSNVLACHDFEFIDIIPDLYHMSCHSHYNKTLTDAAPRTATFLSRSGAWHHLAVTWSAKDNGLMQIYQDGLLVAKAVTGKTDPLVPDGALMLGGEQDCFGGCTDPHQGFYGMMDEIRIWKTVRTQSQIVENMRRTAGNLKDSEGLVAYWNFDDLDSIEFKNGGITKDSSGKGNHLDLLNPPQREDLVISTTDSSGRPHSLRTGSLIFKNSFAINDQIENMPTKDITVEFWAQAVLNTKNPSDAISNNRYAEFLSFATQSKGDGDLNNNGGLADTVFIDDALRIERYLTEYNQSQYLPTAGVSTLGAISVHINANRQGNGKHADNWVDFATQWTDDQWHHIAVTWAYGTGVVQLYFDGVEYVPFWRASEGLVEDKNPNKGGVDASIGQGVERLSTGSLVLGQNQECFGGCLSSNTGFDGKMANVRIWNRVVSGAEIQENMYTNTPSNPKGLVMSFVFEHGNVDGKTDRQMRAKDLMGTNHLNLGSNPPTYQYSYVELTDKNDKPLGGPVPGPAGYAFKLHDEQVLMKENFVNFPNDAITVEFWMWSVDSCREGVPFSYAHGDYEQLDNAFLIFNYNNWGVSVMEKEGSIEDHNAGFGATDGRWHHIAVTWESNTGKVEFYDNGRLAWMVERARGRSIPSGGTLVIGREQDCLGGCFDSMYGAIGDVQAVSDLQYGPQDFFGVMDEIRIWRVVRTSEEIYKGMIADQENGGGQGHNSFINPKDSKLVAYWKFDEGMGFIAKDSTPHGNDLHISEKPDWMIMRWLSTCGDGVLEGAEMCDDGNTKDGDGCSSKCKVEKGYSCTRTSPSECYSSGSPSSKASSTGVTVVVVIIVLVVVTVLIARGYRKREAIYEHFPQVERLVSSSKTQLNKLMGRRPGYDGVLSLDPEADMAPGFVDSQQPTAYQPPGRPGPYTPIPDAGQK